MTKINTNHKNGQSSFGRQRILLSFEVLSPNRLADTELETSIFLTHGKKNDATLSQCVVEYHIVIYACVLNNECCDESNEAKST